MSVDGVLQWKSGAERNRLLRLWRREVLARFGEQSRCIRVAWVLADSFNAKTGYAYPGNKYLADETRMAPNKVQATLRTLELGGAIIRDSVMHNGQSQRVVYPAATLIPTPTVGAGGDPRPLGVHNLNRRPRLPKSELERARLAANIRDGRQHRARGKQGTPDEELEDAASTKH